MAALTNFLPSEWASTEWAPGAVRLPIESVANLTVGPPIHSNERVEIVLERGVDPKLVVNRLRGPDGRKVGRDRSWPILDFQGIKETVDCQLPMPLPALVRRWVREHRRPDLAQALAEMRGLLRDDANN